MSDEQLIPDDEWKERFGWSADENGDWRLLEDTMAISLLSRIGEQFVWSQEDGDDGGYRIAPGMTGHAPGYYLCDRARRPGDEVWDPVIRIIDAFESIVVCGARIGLEPPGC